MTKFNKKQQQNSLNYWIENQHMADSSKSITGVESRNGAIKIC